MCLVSVENLSANYQPFIEDVWATFGTNYDFNYPEDLPSSAAHYFSDYKPQDNYIDFYIAKPPVTCKPMPGTCMNEMSLSSPSPPQSENRKVALARCLWDNHAPVNPVHQTDSI